MVQFDRKDMERLAVSSVGAVALSAACLFAALAPAKASAANAPMSVTAWQQKVESRIDHVREQPGTPTLKNGVAVSQVAVRLSPEGKILDASIARSSGNRRIDLQAICVARGVRYPALPESFRNAPTTVRMTLYFGPNAEAELARDMKKSETIQLAAM